MAIPVQRQDEGLFDSLSRPTMGPVGKGMCTIIGSAMLIAAVAGAVFNTITPFGVLFFAGMGALCMAGANTGKPIYPAIAMILNFGLVLAGV